MQFRNVGKAGLCIFFAILASVGSAEPDPKVNAIATRAAAAIDRLHRNASKALVTAAQDRAYGAYFHTHESAEREILKDRIDHISLGVQDRFHVEEMCLIDPQGKEISRIVGDEIAHDLATNESEAPFFEPGFSTSHQRVYVAPIYLSADAHRWVTAYVTPIVVDGVTESILHYEHGLDAYTSILERISLAASVNLIVVVDTGHIIFDSRTPLSIEGLHGSDDRDDYFPSIPAFDPETLDWLAPHLGAEPDEVISASRIAEGWTVVAWMEG